MSATLNKSIHSPRTIHGSFSDVRTRVVYEFTQRSSGHVAINKFVKCGQLWRGLAVVLNADVFEVMTKINPVNFQYSQGVTTWRYMFPELLESTKCQIVR